MPLVCPKGVGWGNMGYLIPEVAPGDWAIEMLEEAFSHAQTGFRDNQPENLSTIKYGKMPHP